jgi:hypothetical protein
LAFGACSTTRQHKNVFWLFSNVGSRNVV